MVMQSATRHTVPMALGSMLDPVPSALPGSGSLPPDWAEQGSEGLSPHHQELVRAGDV